MSYKLAGVIWNDDGTMATIKPSPLEVSKQLKDFVLEVVKNGLDRMFINGSFDIIEKTLKDYEELTNKPVMLYGRTHGKTQALIDTVCKNYKDVKITNLEDEKKLKALEIIKNKMVDIHNLIYSSNVEEYNKFAMNYNQELCNTLLTQEEYELLKEVLL